MIGVVAARSTWHSEEAAADTEDGGQGEEELETNNKFAHLFRQMLAKQRVDYFLISLTGTEIRSLKDGETSDYCNQRRMHAYDYKTNMDCALSEDCPRSLECVANKCRSMGPRRTKMINLYSRW
ncbi:hypothetical protein B9Z55_011287 [Caenorhabditis nigoni]|uniref:Uncharacterized protein n=1 Tax=Caenorhabditis nigoni TaxID=1611254 RepID=A0A2G5UKA9_9PELO|nr:hypothetical protein B9Z55_011287 [Caenorhabditis nigoni]